MLHLPKLLGIGAISLALGVSAQAQGTSDQGHTDQGSSDQGSKQGTFEQRTNNQRSTERFGYGDRGETAPVPQYWIADAALFIANAVNTADVLDREKDLSVQEPGIIGNQAEFMLDAIERSLDSLDELLANAQDTNPDAVPPIRNAIANLVSAKSQAQAVLDSATSGRLDPTYRVSVRSALDHLRDAASEINDIAKEYRVGDLAITSSRGCGASTSRRSSSRHY